MENDRRSVRACVRTAGQLQVGARGPSREERVDGAFRPWAGDVRGGGEADGVGGRDVAAGGVEEVVGAAGCVCGGGVLVLIREKYLV